MQFVKMHGAGNDYVYVDCLHQPPPKDPGRLAVAVSDRHRGIGSDGLVLILPAERADARMRMWNADGSEAGMCGNGLRCVGKYLFDRGRVAGPEMQIETGSGLRRLRVVESNGPTARVTIEMGAPILEAADIPTTLPGTPPLEAPLALPDTPLRVSCISMGNPHCVVFVEELNDEAVLGLGPRVERHPAFPERTNVEFARVVSAEAVEMRVWERGSGETLACGSGACAVAVAGSLTGRTGRRVECRLPGGLLEVEWTTTGPVFLTGPAVEVFRGEWPDGAPAGRE